MKKARKEDGEVEWKSGTRKRSSRRSQRKKKRQVSRRAGSANRK